MATEQAKGWQQVPPTMPFIGQAWRQMAFQQYLIRAHARMQVQQAIASRMNEYLSQFQQHTAERMAKIKGQLATFETSSESTPQSRSQQTMVLGLIPRLADEGPVTSEKLNKALRDSGMPEAPRSVLQAAINEFYLSKG